MLKEITTLCTCCKISLADGAILAYTDYDQDLVIDDTNYSATQGFSYSNIACDSLFKIDNLQIEGILNAEHINEQDILAGKYDNAQIEILQADYVSHEKTVIAFGNIGKIKILNGKFIAEVNGIAQKAQKQIVDIFSPSCRATFCDHLCTLQTKDFTHAGRVIDIINNKKIFIGQNLHTTIDYYRHGLLAFISGNNKSISIEVKSSINDEVELFLELPYEIKKGDKYIIIAGCDKLFTTCLNKFNNTVNFRGEPHIPGLPTLYKSIGSDV